MMLSAQGGSADLIDIEQGVEKIGLPLFVLSVVSALSATAISIHTMALHLKNYRRPDLQRLTLRILLMIPIYSLTTIISLSARVLSYYIDTVRDVYEAFVIYSFFTLLINYLEGERAILQMLKGRIRSHHLWPFKYCFPAMDMGDPRVFLNLRRGILQFVIIKLILAPLIMILKVANMYDEGYITWESSYLWISLVYNLSICICMYCLALFYLQCKKDLEPYRPVPKFVCVKVIIFLTFWQGLGIAFLVRMGWIHDKTNYTVNNIALALQDFLICVEMPFFALLHAYAFPWTDYDDSRLSSRVPFPHAIRDALGIKDIVQDTYHTFMGTTFKDEQSRASIQTWQRRRRRRRRHENIWGDENDDFVGESSYLFDDNTSGRSYWGTTTTFSDASDVSSLEFPDGEDPETEQDYAQSRLLEFGDFNFPVLSADPRFAHPPVIRAKIETGAQEFLKRVENSSQEALQKSEKAPPQNASLLPNSDSP